jgi:hypothetical protein
MIMAVKIMRTTTGNDLNNSTTLCPSESTSFNSSKPIIARKKLPLKNFKAMYEKRILNFWAL